MKKLIVDVAAASDVSERKLRSLLTELGLAQLLSEARRLQAGEAFKEKRLTFEQEPIPARFIKQAFESLQED